MSRSKAIPDRWTQYQPVGKKIQGTRFIAFKVPLRNKISETVEECQRLDTDMLLEAIPDLGLIIDLTNTDRYYDPQCFESKGVIHKKLRIPGHVTPPQHLIRMFTRYVQEYLKDNKHNNKLIGVHCTHGVNRTGFLICSYMISEMTINPDDAIKEFSIARGHPIERQNYLTALQKMGTNSRIRKHSDDVQHDLPLKRQSMMSHSRESLMNFEQRWNTSGRFNHLDEHHRRNNNYTSSRTSTNHMDNNNRRYYNINSDARWNYAGSSSNISNWRDREYNDQGVQRNSNYRNPYSWNRNSNNNNSNNAFGTRSHHVHDKNFHG